MINGNTVSGKTTLIETFKKISNDFYANNIPGYRLIKSFKFNPKAFNIQ